MSEQDTQQEEAIQTFAPGAVLARARNSQGLSILEVAESLKITESYVKAIEESTFDMLPQAAFVRGYIRNYAKLVGLNGEDLVKDFDHFMGVDGLESPRLQGSRKLTPLRAHSAPSPVYALALLLLVSLGGFGYYLWNSWLGIEPVVEVAIIEEVSDDVPEPLVTDASVVSVPSVAEISESVEEEAVPADDTAIVQEEPGLEKDEPVLKEAGPEVLPIAMASSEVVNTADEPNSPIVDPIKPLVINFSEDCWVEIKDATGEVLISTVQKAGSSINLDVFPPVNLRFGNTPGVDSILLDGEPVAKPSSNTRVASVLLTGSDQG
ncbi:RodZ domain-containing protein [Salinisphaera sp. G21_0]|uniref:RodZ domain-containing protein n=1 Tax=Salinisphaera sp. G21_0 TaxID=2821094 RepID=UPI001ADB7D37|nr:RodZ domain-containing protein [Salinisphaera sp. G21_0]MBO9479824.1 helix-turn-helix domain-containing protein [Salinisphaera sp. G21_0]